MADPRFFLGHGERLTSRIPPPGGGGGSEPAYTFEEAIARLTPMMSDVVSELDALPDEACPADEAVGVVTLHPQWLAKSYHPDQLLREYGLRQIGSRPTTIQPERWTRQVEPEPAASSELYVAGERESFRRWSHEMQEQPSRVSNQIRQVELVRVPTAEDRLRNVAPHGDAAVLFEVVLHASEGRQDDFILSGFSEYAGRLGVKPHFDRRLHAGGLCFLPVEAKAEAVEKLAEFAFLRVARPMPRLRALPQIERSTPQPRLRHAPLPEGDAVDPDLRLAVFDGGLDEANFGRWAASFDVPGIGPAVDKYARHGHDVTSALLFGPLAPGKTAERPYAVVDHYRVLDTDSDSDPFELYDALHRIDDVLRSRNYQFFNISIGPAWSVEDDEVHAWTAILDQHLSSGDALASLAIGNTGLEDRVSGDARIQVPSDCVNGLSVGAADTTHADWRRASYSSWGPGRSPGVVKPDLLQFGGEDTEPFLVYDAASAPALAQTCGTSFAAPSALRLAAGLRAHFGGRLGPLALKTLLVHSCDPSEHHRDEVGWGRVAGTVSDIAVCEDGMVRVIYQGELSPAQYLRAPIPIPDDPLLGFVTLSATFCYATVTDPQDPGSYTRSGLEVVFRPHASRFASDEATVPKSRPFFRRAAFKTEQESRNDAQKWETTLHASDRFRPTSLLRPVFDIHYNAREAGGAARDADRIKYALVVTLRAPRVPDLYDRVVRTYSSQLQALVPIVDIPVRV